MLKDNFKQLPKSNRNIIYSHINVFVKFLYIYLNNQCLTSNCNKCRFYVYDECTFEKVSPEEWQYMDKLLEDSEYYMTHEYNPNYNKIDPAFPKALKYFFAMSYLCNQHMYDCKYCKFKGNPATPKWCTITEIIDKILSLKNDS